MYEYSSLESSWEGFPNIPSDEMWINGESIAESISAYRQLYVNGRHLINQEIDMTTVPMRHGAWFNHAVDEVRVITVGYQIMANSSEELRTIYEELNRILRSDDLLEIRFRDEWEWEYRGVFQSGDTPPEQSLSFTGEFTLIMPDPYKYKDKQSSDGLIRLRHAESVKPERIELQTEETNTFSVINGDKEIVFVNGSYASGGKVVIEFGQEEVTIEYNGRSILSELRWNTDLENFDLRDGDTVTGENCEVISVEWRDKRR